MELLTHLIRVDTTDTEARHLKAEAMRTWGYRQRNIFWRNQALGGANELDDLIDYSTLFDVAPADVIKTLPVNKIVESLRVRLDPDKSRDTRLAIAFDFTDSDTLCTLEIRRGVAVFHNGTPITVAATLTMTTDLVHHILTGDLTPADALRAGTITIDGDETQAHTFFTYFDDPAPQPPRLIVR